MGKKIYIGKRQTSLINDARKLRYAHTYIRLKQTQLSVYKNQLKLVKLLSAESENEKLQEETEGYWDGQRFYIQDTV